MTNNKIHKVLMLDKRFLWAEPHVLILHFFPDFRHLFRKYANSYHDQFIRMELPCLGI